MLDNNVYERIHHNLSWKRIITFNVILFLVTVIPLSVRLAQEDTENRSNAAEHVVPEVIPPPNYPELAPKIERVVEWFGKRGDTIVILGKNFGNYQWESKIFVGDVQADKTDIVRWSDKIIEVQIPEQARTGKVWIVVNGKQTKWRGNLLLTDVNRSAKITLSKIDEKNIQVSLFNAGGAKRGMVELAYMTGPLEISSQVALINKHPDVIDSLGKKIQIEFELNQIASSNQFPILKINYPGIGEVEIIRAELYDTQARLISVYAEPFKTKVR